MIIKIALFVIIISLCFSCKKEYFENDFFVLSNYNSQNINKSTAAYTSLEDIKLGVFDILKKMTNLTEFDSGTFPLATNFFTDLKFDNLEMADLKVKVEEKFNCTLSIEKYEKVLTVGDLITELRKEVIINYTLWNSLYNELLIHFNATSIDEYVSIRFSYKIANNENGTKFNVIELKSSLASPSSYVKDDNKTVSITYESIDTNYWDILTKKARCYAVVKVVVKKNGVTTSGVCNLMFNGIINMDSPTYEPKPSIEYGDVTVDPPISNDTINTALVFSKLKLIISDHLPNPVVDISKDSNFRENLGCDNLDVWEIAMDVEEEFYISFTDIQPENIQTIMPTVGDMCNYILQKQKK